MIHFEFIFMAFTIFVDFYFALAEPVRFSFSCRVVFGSSFPVVFCATILFDVLRRFS